MTGAPDGFDLGAPHHTRAGSSPYDIVLVFCPDVATLRRLANRQPSLGEGPIRTI